VRVAKNCWLLLQFSKKMPKVNNRSIGENSAHLVTLSPMNTDYRGKFVLNTFSGYWNGGNLFYLPMWCGGHRLL
jgi:hypothetical protein